MRRGIVFGTAAMAVVVGVPAAWILAAWSLGPKLANSSLPFLTPLLLLILVIGVPASVALCTRLLIRADARTAARTGRQPVVRVRPPRLGQIRPEVPVLDDPPRRAPTGRRRVASAALLATMAAALALLLLGAPTAMVWIASQLAGTTQPTFGPYLFVLVGTSLAIAAGVRLLRPIQGLYARVSGELPRRDRRQTAWLQGLGAERGIRRPERGLETIMIGAVLVSAAFLAVWFFVLGDPTGIAERFTRG